MRAPHDRAVEKSGSSGAARDVARTYDRIAFFYEAAVVRGGK